MLEVRDIDVAYGRALALQGVSLKVEAGQMVFIVGRNGAGKTTLLKTICGLLTPIRGGVELQGESIAGQAPEKLALKGVSYVAQDKKVFSQLTVRSNIELAAHAVGIPLDHAIEQVLSLYPKMERFLDTEAGGLSGGQREILLIGRALVSRPKLLMIDEPTEGLAAVVIDDIFRILSSMKSELTTVIVEQNLAVVSRLADRIFVMKEGKIIKHLDDPKAIGDAAALEAYL